MEIAPQSRNEYHNKHSIEHRITLTDGRQLGYAEYGSPTGEPVVFCHGAPGSRRSIFNDMSRAAAQRNLRIIAPDRPGYGLSTYIERKSLLDWVADLEELTHVLGIESYSLIGFSTGSLSAFANAYALPEKIKKVSIVGALAPMEIAGVLEGLSPTSCDLFALARSDKLAFSNIINSLAPNAAALFTAMASTMSEPDNVYLTAHQSLFETDFAATLATGTQGLINDLILAANPWGISPAKINCPIDLWVGSEDRNTPPAMTRYLATELPNSRAYKLAGAGHCCLYTHWESILNKLMDVRAD